MANPVRYVTDDSGKKTDVILELSEYEKLLEDIDDLASIVERRDEPVIDHKSFLEELRKDGIL